VKASRIRFATVTGSDTPPADDSRTPTQREVSPVMRLLALPESLSSSLSALVPALEGDAGPIALWALGLGGVAGLGVGVLLGAGLVSLFVGRSHSRLRDRFESLSNEALDRSSDRFLTLAGERLGAATQSNEQALERREAAVEALVRPLRESLAKVDEKLQRVETEREGHYRALTNHLELVATNHRALASETQGLRQALGTPNVRGRWGELQLRRVCELAGMLEHCDFEQQVTVDDPGRRSRPDLVVRLPGGRSIVIDAKAPLQAYLAAAEATTDEEREARLVEHARHVRRHVDDLSGRAYWSSLEGSPEFVVLFLPGEPFFASALATDPELIERGVGKKVLLAGPTTLIALLRAVAYGWQQEAMAENAIAVSKLGKELFERIVSLNDRFSILGKKLDGAVEAYNTAIGSLESRVHVSARRMAELGIANASDLGRNPPIEKATRRSEAKPEARAISEEAGSSTPPSTPPSASPPVANGVA